MVTQEEVEKPLTVLPLKNFRSVYFYILNIVLTSLMIWFPCTQIRSNKLKGGNELLEIAKIKKFPWYRGENVIVEIILKA